MCMKKITNLVICLLTIGLFVIQAEAAGKSKIKGTLYSINVSANTVTLKDLNGALSILNITSKLKIKRNGMKAGLTDLVLGDQLVCSSSGSLSPRKLKATGPKVSLVTGAVQSIHSGAKMIQVGNQNVPAGANTRITRNGKASSLSSITLNDHAVVHFKSGSNLSSDDQGEDEDAEDIQCEGPDEEDVEGTISSVDVNANTVTIHSEDDGSDVTVNVTPETEIEVDGEDATIVNLLAGQRVEAEFDHATFNAFRIEVDDEMEEAEIEGSITAVDAGAGTVTIQDENGKIVTLIVNATTEVKRDDEPAFLSDLLVGDCAKAKYDAITLEAFRIEAESECEEAEVEGSITEVNVPGNTVSITDEDGNVVTLSVTANTQIERDDETALLSNLQVGDEAEAKYNPTTLVASSIEASSENGDDDDDDDLVN